MSINSDSSIAFERVYVTNSKELMKRDVIVLKPRALYTETFRCHSQCSKHKINVVMSTPTRRQGCFISNAPLLDFQGRMTNRHRTRMYGLRNIQGGNCKEIQYCSRDGALWIEVEFIESIQMHSVHPFQNIAYERSQPSMAVSPLITFRRSGSSENTVQYECFIEGSTQPILFSIEYCLIQENLPIKELQP